MSAQSGRPRFPRAPLLGAAALVACAMLAAAVGRLTGADTPDPMGSVAAARDIRVADRADGAVLVYDAQNGRQIEAATGQNGFLRGTLRALARERRLEGLGSQAAFRLIAWNDGRLTLDDPSTGRRVELEAFGSENAAVFARLLTTQGGRS